MRVLVTGASGMLGREVVAAARTHEVVALDHVQLDITDERDVHLRVREVAPDVIINCAAYTAVDRCEHDRDTAFAVNDQAVRCLAAAATDRRARMVHVSTDYVFDGSKIGPYVESDSVNPTSIYGESKLAGEAPVLALGPDGLVVRTAWGFGVHGNNMVRTVIGSLRDQATLRFVDDQVGSPTSAADLAAHLFDLIAADASGVVHATNRGAVSWFGFVREILTQLGADPQRVQPITTADLDPPRPAARPANSVLVSERLHEWNLAPLRAYELALAEVLERLASS